MTDKEIFALYSLKASMAYIDFFGITKWNSLTDTQKYDAIIKIAKNMNKDFE